VGIRDDIDEAGMVVGKMMNLKSYKTTCSYCGVGCGMIVKKDRNDRITIEGDPDHPVNRGMLCSKGLNLHYAIQNTEDRLLYPQMRWSRNHPLERVTWDDAFKRAAAVFRSTIKMYGPDSVGFYVSGQCLTEEYYIANKLVKGFLGTNNIDTNSRLCMSTAVAAHTAMLGEDAVPICYDDIELSDCLLIAGANPAWCHPILFRRMEAHKKLNPGVKLIVVDPRKTQSCAVADLHLQIIPGTDIYLYHGIGRVLLESGDVDYNFITNHTENFEHYREALLRHSVEDFASLCGVGADDIRLAAQWIADAKGFLTLWAMGLNQSSIGVKKNTALISLNLLTGKIGRPGSGPFSLTGQPNAMGGREVGGLATMLAAHRQIANETHRREVQEFWKSGPIADKPGLTATQMLEALESGKLRALWVICTNPVISWPDARRAEAALKNAKFLVVQDISKRSDTVQFADLVLPAAGHMEKEGTMTNSERRITLLEKILDPPGEAKPDVEILSSFARAMGFQGFDHGTTSEIYDEHAQLTKGTNIDISGLNYQRLTKEGSIQWPVPNSSHQGTSRLFDNHRFYTPSGKARFATNNDAENLSEPLTPEFPLVLTTGRIRDQWHTMTKTGKVNKLKRHIDKPFLEINPVDADLRNIRNSDIVVVANSRGKVQVRAKVTDDVRPGVVFLPMHWGLSFNDDLARANNLTSTLTDPVSKEPDFKFSAVDVSLYVKKKEKIIIAGAGAASYRFICSYRALNPTDTIDVISKEEDVFYNRVLLPEYANEKLTWARLQKFRPNEIDAYDVGLQSLNEIVSINRVEKYIVDKYQRKQYYDKLILATGSRANLPKDAAAGMNGVFTMRTRKDADQLKSYLTRGAQVLIVGGGLLGLELASSLRDIDIEVSVAQLGSRLMERQIDRQGGELLLDFIEEKGITVYMNDQVQSVMRTDDKEMQVRFRSGKIIVVKALVYAVGTQLNIEYAIDAGLDMARGIIVNDRMQTSDPDIFAIGEIAEHRGKTFGITAAAERQADVVANFIAGDMQSTYEGTAPMNILKLEGLDLCSIGIAEVPPGGEDYEEVLFIDKAKRFYKKCIIKDDRLVGAVLIGDKSEFAEFKELIENRSELSERRLELLRSGKKVDPPIGKIVCSCNNVGDGNLRQLINAGCSTLPDLCTKSGAGLGCGSCKPEIQLMLQSGSDPAGH
jgi:ferredoxin-nitrate reductase